MSESEQNRTTLHVALAVLAVLIVLYSLLVATRPLSGIITVLLLFGVYLAWRLLRLAVRFVDAFERIADAMERERVQE